MVLIRHKQDKTINLENVSNIFIDENNGTGKVIFNMNYSVKIFGDKFTPDYVYWEFNSEDDLDYIKRTFLPKVENWIQPIEDGQRYINPKCVSSIGYDSNKNRVIFNLNYNVTHPKDKNKLTSDFVFFNFTNRENYTKFIQEMGV